MTMEKNKGMASGQLTLQQKMVQIRKGIPALVRRAYSEEVSYDFVKIDDIYRHMAPAMNQFQVNLEIVAEQATRKDEHGNPVFVQYMPQCQMWMYEVDLTLKWINAENPADTDSTVIHAIGSHEFPDKAKGSAWTYALKYYLLNKFCIDQGGEDPDMRGLKAPETDGGENGSNYYDENLEMQEETETQEEMETQEETETQEEMETQPPKHSGNDAMEEPEGGKEPLKDVQRKMKEHTPEVSAPKPTVPLKQERQQAAIPPANQEKQPTPPVSGHIKPEQGDMVKLPESAKDSMESEVGMTVEEAMQIKCTPGAYGEHTLGSLIQLGEEGLDALVWYANGYRGRRSELRTGANLLLHSAKAA